VRVARIESREGPGWAITRCVIRASADWQRFSAIRNSISQGENGRNALSGLRIQAISEQRIFYAALAGAREGDAIGMVTGK